MKTQFDHKVRTVSLENLRAMCARASGVCHRYEVIKVSRSRVHVQYSNPDEYGTPNPVTAVYPCYPSTFDLHENPAVVIGEYLRIVNDRDGTAHQVFDAVFHTELWRQPIHGGDAWYTRAEIDGTDWYLCPDNKLRKVDRTHPYTGTTFAAFDVTEETPAETFARIGGTRHFAYYTWTDCKPAKPGMYGREA